MAAFRVEGMPPFSLERRERDSGPERHIQNDSRTRLRRPRDQRSAVTPPRHPERKRQSGSDRGIPLEFP